MTVLRVAVVGSGPSGCYAAEALLKQPGVAVDIVDRSPMPFGLVRAGVAPDHQTTKAVARVLERTLGRPGARFFGHVEVGRDVSLDLLRRLYDAVVLAVGAPLDRRLGVPGEDLPGVVGSGALVGWYNSAAAVPAALPDLAAVRHVLVVGAGNVAIDVVRLLAKTEPELTGSDLADAVGRRLAAAPIETITVLARRGPADVAFTPVELAELGTLARVGIEVEPFPVPDGAAPAVPVLAGFAGRSRADAPVSLRFRFQAQVERFEGGGRLERAVLTTGIAIPADLAVTCIGYGSVGCPGADPVGGRIPNDEGWVGERLYVVGWAKRGPSGTIATNRAEAQAVAARLLREVRPGRAAGDLADLLAARGVTAVDLAGWKRIDAAEVARARPGRVRAKILDPAEAVAIAATAPAH